jgi:hypothetical protein
MQNDSLNVVVGKPHEGDIDATKKTDCRGIDFVYHAPFLDIFVRCSEFIVGGNAELPTENLSSQFIAMPPSERVISNCASTVVLKEKQRFNLNDLVFRIISVTGDSVHALCVYGNDKGSFRMFKVEEVSRIMLTNLTT